MEAHRHFAKPGSGGRGSALSSRRNSIIVAVLSAVLAAALIYLFVSHYRKSAAPPAPVNVSVWVAKAYIPAGTPESVIAEKGLLKPSHVPATQAAIGAISDPSVITGESASAAIAAGQQVTVGDFSRAPGSLAASLTGTQRAVAFTLDSEHGLTTFLQPQDTVDVMAVKATGSSELLAQDVTVLENQAGVVVLRLSDRQALLVTAATGVSSLWLSLRPALSSSDSVPVGSVGR